MKGSTQTFARNYRTGHLSRRLYSNGRDWFYIGGYEGRIYMTCAEIYERLSIDARMGYKTRVRVRAGRQVI
jgi:hypothetical protein